MNSRRFHRLLAFFGMFLAPLAGVKGLTVMTPAGPPQSGAIRISMAMVEGRPAIAWSNRVTLQYVLALDANGTAWGDPVTVNPGPTLGAFVSLRIVNGKPAVTNFDFSGGLKFFRAEDSAGSIWSPGVLIATGNPPLQTTMEIVDGNPAVAFRQSGIGLTYRRATDPDGTSWGPQVVADNIPGSLFHSMKIVQGRPAIAFADSSGLFYVRATDAAGAAWLPRVSVAPAPGAIHCSMEVVNGHPAISYTTPDTITPGEVLTYVRASDPEGTAWGTPVTPDSVEMTGLQSSLAVVNGKPAIAYHSSTVLNDSRYLQAKDSNGAAPDAWNPPLTLENIDITGESPALLEVNGWPAVAFFNVSQASLHYLRATNPGEDTLWGLELLLQHHGHPVANGGTMHCEPLEPGAQSTFDVFIQNLNPRGDSLHIQSLTIDGPDAAEFLVVAPPATPVAAGAQSKFTLQHAPVTAGIKTAALHLTTDAASPFTLYDVILKTDGVPSLSVEWPAGAALTDGGSLNFPVVAAGTTSDLTFTVRNTGDASMTGLVLTLDGPDSSEYSVAAAPAPAVAAGDSTTFTLRVAPQTTEGSIASFHLASNVAGNRNPFDFTVRRFPGTVDASFRPFTTGEIFCLAVQADGTILAGGSDSVAAFHPGGSPDLTFFPPSLFGGPVSCMAAQKDGRILIGGGFTRLDGQERPGFARLLPDGSLDHSFHPDFNIPSGIVCMAVQADGKIVGASPERLLRVHPDGSQDTAFAPRVNFQILSLALQPDGKILIGGWFNMVNEITTGSIARLRPDGTLDATFSGNLPFGVRSLALQPDGRIYAAGVFPGGIARLFPDGIRDPSVALTFDSDVNAVILQADGRCLAAGIFNTVNGTARSHLARINADGTLDETFEPPVNGEVIRQVALQGDGSVLLCGDFTQVGGIAQSRFARLGNDPPSTRLQMSGNSTVRWMRGGAAPEVSGASFDVRPARTAEWTPLGPGTRTPGGWELSGLTLPTSASIRAQAYAGGSVMESVTSVLTPLESWRESYFTTAANTGDAADDADPDLDGLTNLAEFALGLSPVNGGSRTLPEFKLTGTSYTASFTVPEGRDGVIIGAEWSATMQPGSWTNIPDAGAGAAHVFSVSAAEAHVFARFVVRLR